MSLLDDHEENLALILEDKETFGVDIKFIRPDKTTFTVQGEVNLISRHISTEFNKEVTGRRSNCALRMSTLPETPKEGWIIETSPQPGREPVKQYMIESGGIFPDYQSGTIVIFLTENEAVI